MTDSANKPGAPRLAATIGGGAWTVAERVISQASQLILFVVAARLLSPAEFGTFALVSTCALLLLRMSEVGWAPYIMSWHGDERVPRQVLGVSIVSGLGAGVVVALAGLAARQLYAAPEVGNMLLLFAVWVALATVSSAQQGMMIWQDGLRGSAIAESVGEILGMAVAVAALYEGHGVYSLVYGRLTFQATHLAISFVVTRRAPLFGMERAEFRSLCAYSGQIFFSRTISAVRVYIATFVIGGFLGPAPVGYYRAAQRLVGAVAEVIGAPSYVLAWSMFRQARDNHGLRSTGFQRQANLYFKLLIAAGVPVLIWTGLMGADLISGLLGPKWLPALPLIGVLAIARALALPSAAIEPVLSLNGEVRRLPGFTLVFLVLAAAATALGALFGLMGVAWAQVAVGLAAVAAGNRLMRRHGGIDWREVLREARMLVAPILLGTLTILALREAPTFAHLPALARALGVVLPALAVYAAALMISDPWLKGLAARRLRRWRQA
ncbi:oligosaccharide flippase family protein [Solirhodobacter olei]|uniref:oligosaccharide flippase family protein n=1 Tax=Solirhodobacter olei TaxID=2493082 RepID=UPI0013E34C94|nr:oligosaccharide flippase family protein [Solirhodobacter olei]